MKAFRMLLCYTSKLCGFLLDSRNRGDKSIIVPSDIERSCRKTSVVTILNHLFPMYPFSTP